MPDEGENPEREEADDEAEVPLEELEELETRDKETGSASGRRTQQPVKNEQMLRPDAVEAPKGANVVVRGLDGAHRLERGRRTAAYDPARSGAEPSGAGRAGSGSGNTANQLPPTSSDGSEVVPTFEHGDMHRPYVIGPGAGASRSIDRILALVAVALAVGSLGAVLVFHGANSGGSVSVLFAAVDANGTVAEQSHVVSVSVLSGTGDYNVTFDRNVSGCAYHANPGQWPGSGSPATGTLPYRTATAPDSVFVRTGAPGAFYLDVTC